MSTGVKGTYQYLSPELLLKKKQSTEYIDLFACDMWALGIVIYQMVYFKFPFSVQSKQEMKKEILDLNFSYPGSEFDEIIRGLLVRDPSERFTSKQLLEHLNGCVDY